MLLSEELFGQFIKGIVRTEVLFGNSLKGSLGWEWGTKSKKEKAKSETLWNLHYINKVCAFKNKEVRADLRDYNRT